jgi:serine/threonine protein kinase/tetratricopeptide (TPR) repeat protein
VVNQTLGHYRIVEKIGAGGMGEVYRAHDERLERDVAIKVLPVGTLADEAARKRFRKEALALAKLNHPNIATIYDFDTQDGVDFLVTEYIPGITLSDRLASGPLTEKEVARLGGQLAEGLAAAHDQQVVHRDLKPGNLRVTPDGRLKVLDFGLAKLLLAAGDAAQTLSLSETDGVSGTLPYMPPEQLSGGSPDTRSDIYGAGTVLYEMATGQRPFRERLISRLTDSILHQPPVPPRSVNSRVSTELERIILKCLEKEPENRYQSATELGIDLRRLGTTSTSGPGVRAVSLSNASPRFAIFAGIAIALLLGALLAFNVGSLRDLVAGRPAKPQIRSLAVLPLDNFSQDPSQDYFADGMTEELTADLSQISGLRVISRTSVMRYKHLKKPLPEIARELNVDAMVEGSVLSSGGRVRITAQLIYAPADQHIWAKTYERNLSDVLLLQSEVARTIADEIRITLTPQEQLRLAGARRVNPEAQDAYLKGRYYWEKRTSDSRKKAFEYFQQALDKDPRYAPAYVGIAEYYSVLPFYTNSTPDEVFPKAKAAASKALELDDTLAEAHASEAYIRAYYDWDWAGADQEFRRSLALNPNDASVHHRYSRFLASLGRVDEALTEIKRARELDPLSLVVKANRGVIYYFGGRYDEAIDELKSLLEKEPNFSVAYWGLGLAYEQKKMYKQAIASFEKASDLDKGDSNWIASLGHAYAEAGDKPAARKKLDELKFLAKQGGSPPYQFALVYAALGEKDQAFEALEKAEEERSTLLTYLKMDPRLNSLHSDPRFQKLSRRMRFPQSD